MSCGCGRAKLGLSTVEETVEVAGQSPVVDSVNTRLQTSFSREVLAAVPSARDYWAVLSQSPAVYMSRIDVGGSTSGTQTSYRAYGMSSQVKPVIEGIIGLESSGSVGFYYDYGSFEEVNIGAAGQGAEMATPGVQSVFVSKSGGNQFHGDFYTDYENSRLETTNIDQNQIDLGVRPGSNRIHMISDLNLGGGGYIKKDKIWWFGSYRRQMIQRRVPNFPPLPFETEINDFTGKLTYQLPGNNKLIGYTMYGIKKQPYRQLAQTISSSTALYSNPNSTWNQWNPGYVWKVEWNKAWGSNLFVEARIARWVDDWQQSKYTDEPRREDLITLEVTGGSRDWKAYQDRPQTTGALSYYNDSWGGSHNIKFGWELQMDGRRERWAEFYPGNVVNVLRNGAAAEVYLGLAPLDSNERLYWYGLYASDNWNLGNVTLNLGLRYDRYRSAYPGQYRPANEFAPALEIPAVDNIITWNVLAPRSGVAWDVRGDGNNVVKTSVGRYYHNPSRTVTNTVNPNTFPQWERYTWTDLNGDLVWQRGEEGRLLGTRGGVARGTIDPNLKDSYTDEFTLWFERQIANNFGVRTGVVYKRSNRLLVTVNALNPYDAFSIPVTAVDPGVDGITGTSDDAVLNVFNLQPDLIGQTLSTVVNPPGYTTNAWTWEIAANRRFSTRWSMNASYAITWRDDWNAYPQNPNDPPQTGMLTTNLAKISGSFDPGLGFRVTPLLRFQQGDPFARMVSVRLNYGSETVEAEPRGARRQDNYLLLDLRAERRFRLGNRWTAGLFFDVFNILNSNAVASLVTTTGSSFLRPSDILSPRVVKLGAKLSF